MEEKSGKKRGRVENLTPFKKGKKGGPGRPRGRAAKTLLRIARRMGFQALMGEDGLSKMQAEEVWALRTMQRAIEKGGHDAELMLERTEGKVIDRQEITARPAVDYTDAELAAIAEIEIARKRRENGKG